LRKRIQQLLKDRELAMELGSNARKTAIEYVQFARFLEKWEEAFSRLGLRVSDCSDVPITSEASDLSNRFEASEQSEIQNPKSKIEGLRETNYLYAPAIAWEQANWQQVLETYVQLFRPENPVALILHPHIVESFSDERLESLAFALQAHLMGKGYDLERLPDIILLDKTTAESPGLPAIAGHCKAMISAGDPVPEGVDIPVLPVQEWQVDNNEAA
jgi:hypothetical protein